jgi:transitional endoplasmic reticulum ATPase
LEPVRAPWRLSGSRRADLRGQRETRRLIRRGANILFYGPPGTGKSEFAKTLGAQIGFSVHFCGEADEESAEPDRRVRIAALLIANAISRVAQRTIVVVDEAGDLLFDLDDDGAFGRHGSKVFMNRLLERTVAPTIWIVNDVDRPGPSIIRRMNLALRFPKPTLSARKSMIARIATHADLRLQDSEMLDLARAPAPPALIENAILSASISEGLQPKRTRFWTAAYGPWVADRYRKKLLQFLSIRR